LSHTGSGSVGPEEGRILEMVDFYFLVEFLLYEGADMAVKIKDGQTV
jgi:hypothetical protein